jgi:hypothetical protein
MSFQNPTEEFVYNLCRSSFLSLWSYANPRRDGSPKELCDVLVVCEPHVLIFSVKHSELKNQDDKVAVDRWTRKTVDAAVEAIYGAERNLARATATHVTRSDGQKGLPLPPLEERRVHRISVSLGGERSMTLTFKDWGKGHVHCFDDLFAKIALEGLDTISDFTGYLEAKEQLHRQKTTAWISGGEEALLAVYLHNGRAFPSANLMMLEDDLWDGLSENPAYRRRLKAEKVSYVWDHLIEYLAQQVISGMELGGTLSENESALRIMTRETRFGRRMLAEGWLEFYALARESGMRARIVSSISGVTYVFFNAPPTDDRQARISELGCRCLIARNEIPQNRTVVGIGMNMRRAPKGFATDLVVLSYPEWTPEHRAHAEAMKQDLGFFRNAQIRSRDVEEYPEE